MKRLSLLALRVLLVIELSFVLASVWASVRTRLDLVATSEKLGTLINILCAIVVFSMVAFSVRLLVAKQRELFPYVVSRLLGVFAVSHLFPPNDPSIARLLYGCSLIPFIGVLPAWYLWRKQSRNPAET